jgi:hypothetical protein
MKRRVENEEGKIKEEGKEKKEGKRGRVRVKEIKEGKKADTPASPLLLSLSLVLVFGEAVPLQIIVVSTVFIVAGSTSIQHSP